MDFPQSYNRSVDREIEPCINAWESIVQKLKVHDNVLHVEINSFSNPMDPLQGHLFLEAWNVPSWESTEASMLAPYLSLLHYLSILSKI
jgi:hypothetical protein